MKLLRYGKAGAEQPGAIDAQGCIRSLTEVLSRYDGNYLSVAAQELLKTIDLERLPIVQDGTRIGPPVKHVQKFVAVGLNYVDHAKEAKLPVPSEPVIFMKATSSICGPNDDTEFPVGAIKLDWEVELGIVIGKKAKNVSINDAESHIFGYCVVNDVSERSFQLERGGQWTKGKSVDTFGPIGPYLVTADEVPDPQALSMWLDVNGEPMQRGNTKEMIFNCKYLVSYISQFMTLLPGDVITTGTPCGVGVGRTPSKFLNVGDVVTLGIQGLGEQRQRIVKTGVSNE